MVQSQQSSSSQSSSSTSKVKTSGSTKERQISYLRNQLRLRDDIIKDQKTFLDARNSNSVVVVNRSYDGVGIDDDFLAHPSYSNSRMSDCPSAGQSDILNLSPNLDGDARDTRRAGANTNHNPLTNLDKVSKVRAKSKNSVSSSTASANINSSKTHITRSEESDHDPFRLPHLAAFTSPTKNIRVANSQYKVPLGNLNLNTFMNNENTRPQPSYHNPANNSLVISRQHFTQQSNKSAFPNDYLISNDTCPTSSGTHTGSIAHLAKDEHTSRTNTRSPSKRDLTEFSMDLEKRARIQKQRSGAYSSNSQDSASSQSSSSSSNRYNSSQPYEPKVITSQTTGAVVVLSQQQQQLQQAQLQQQHSNRNHNNQSMNLIESETAFHTSSSSVLSNRSYQRRPIKPRDILYNQQQQNTQIQQQQQLSQPPNQQQQQSNSSHQVNSSNSRIQLYLNKDIYPSTASQDQNSNKESNGVVGSTASASNSNPPNPSDSAKHRIPRVLEIPPLQHLPQISTSLPESVSSSVSTQWSAKARNKIKQFGSESNENSVPTPSTTATANIMMHDKYADRGNGLGIRAVVAETAAQKLTKFEERKSSVLQPNSHLQHMNSLRKPKESNARDHEFDENLSNNRFTKVRQSVEEARSSRDARNDRLKQLNLNIRNLKHHDIKVSTDVIPSSTMSVQLQQHQHRNGFASSQHQHQQQQENIPMHSHQRDRANSFQPNSHIPVRRNCASQNQNPIQFKRQIDHRSERSISAKIPPNSRLSGAGGAFQMKF